MEISEIVEQLRINTGRFPREALVAAIEQREAITPELLNFIEYTRNNIEQINKAETVFMGHIYALYLLAQFRENAAYAPIVELFSTPGRIIYDITGDVITEDLHRILASVCNGDSGRIEALAKNRKADEYVRGACIRTMLTLMLEGQRTRDEVVAYFGKLFHGGLEREFSHVWNALVSCSTDIHPGELFDEITKAFEEDLFETGYVSFKEIEREKLRAVESSIERLKRYSQRTFINDTIEEMQSWACFKKDKRYVPKKSPFSLPSIPSTPYDDDDIDKPPPKIGRNEPCPCGSGKKYKKCCGKSI